MATTDPRDGGERRLHPLSWLFVLLQQLRQFVVPLLVLLFVGRGDRNELWPLIGVAVLVLVSLWRYFTFRYRITGDSVVVQSGLLERSLREIPFSRIHNVAVHQSLLHRAFGVAEVRLESAGGQKPEAEMRVLKLADATALEALIRHRGTASTTVARDDATAGTGSGTLLLALPPGEVLRLGLVSNRGLLVLGGAAAAASQVSPRVLPNLFESWGQALFGYAGSHQFAASDYAIAAISLALGFVVLLRLFSLVLALLQYFGFRLEEHDRRLTVERGLLTRLRTSTSRRRIQAFTLQEGVLHRLLRRRTLDVDTAVADNRNDQRALHELAPIATPDTCDTLVRHVLPHAQWPPAQWSPLHARAWWRLALPGIVLPLLLAAGLSWRFGAWGLLALLWVPWAMFVARMHAQRAGYACDDVLVAVRAGWWSRHWRFAELDKLQALQLRQSPLDRALGMASLWLDTAGAGALAKQLRIRHLPEAEARALHARLGRFIARRPLRW
jgi:putative membrane protein